MSGSRTHGFLFADVRGYTSFLDRRGAAAAAALLDRFRVVVRSAVAAHSGAEIRTEGDSFYIVFPSASSAVACALDILAATTTTTADEEPIRVGIGVHAGEALETPDGPVGTAVNIAARLCAMAQPGEVLVSDTVRALTRSVGHAGFVALGRRSIKGLDEALSVYRAVPAGTAMASPGRSTRRILLALTAVLVAVLGLASLAVTIPLLIASPPRTSGVATSPGPPESLRALTSLSAIPAAPTPAPGTPLPTAGTFTTQHFAVPFQVELGPGWEWVGDQADLVAFFHPDEPQGWIDVILIAAALEPPCDATPPTFIGERPEDVIEWLTTRKWLDHAAPRPYNIGSYLGRAVDIEVLLEALSACPASDDSASFFRMGSPETYSQFGSIWGADAGERKRVIAVDVDGRTVTLVSGSPFESVESFWELTEPLLQTIRFTGE